jgi:hypothetical protein
MGGKNGLVVQLNGILGDFLYPARRNVLARHLRVEARRRRFGSMIDDRKHDTTAFPRSYDMPGLRSNAARRLSMSVLALEE